MTNAKSNVAAVVVAVMGMFALASQAHAGAKEYHECMDAGNYHEQCKHHL